MATRTAVRIIGGEFNGRKLSLPANAQLRPSGGRVREALFSCLGDLAGLHCLDLFAGSGALGLTAASNGAAAVTLVEKNRRTAAALAEQVAVLQARNVAVRAMPAARFLATHSAATPKFDVVFLDPPFGDTATDTAWARLLAAVSPHLADDARVYGEHHRLPAVPAGWRRLTARKVGEVHWQILQTA